jgi:hypothetical protein
MSPVVYAILSALGALFRSQRFIASREHRSTTSAGDLSAHRHATAHSTRRPHLLVLAVALLGHMAGGSGFRPARDRYCMTTQTLSRPLEAAE